MTWMKSGRRRHSLISRLERSAILGQTMESLEITVLPVILIGALLLGAIWAKAAVHWLTRTEPLR